MTTDNNTTDTQPEEAAEAIWEMPDYTQTAEAIDEMMEDLEVERMAAEAQDEQDWWTTVRDHS